MCVDNANFDAFEQQFIELVSEFQTLTISESKLREALRSEAARAEMAEAARDSAVQAAADARANAASTAAGVTRASKALATTQEDLLEARIQLELADRQKALLEGKHSEMSEKLSALENELDKLRPVQSAHFNLQRQYVELQERIQNATNDARNEANRLENELRRVERCASAGSEVRERARLAAAAHARDRRFAAAELQHAAAELRTAHAEIARLSVRVAELQHILSNQDTKKNIIDAEPETLPDVRAALEAERTGAARLEKALAAALADNALLAAQINKTDNYLIDTLAPSSPNKSTVCPIDSFLAE